MGDKLGVSQSKPEDRRLRVCFNLYDRWATVTAASADGYEVLTSGHLFGPKPPDSAPVEVFDSNGDAHGGRLVRAANALSKKSERAADAALVRLESPLPDGDPLRDAPRLANVARLAKDTPLTFQPQEARGSDARFIRAMPHALSLTASDGNEYRYLDLLEVHGTFHPGDSGMLLYQPHEGGGDAVLVLVGIAAERQVGYAMRLPRLCRDLLGPKDYANFFLEVER